jgi:hypothetical protein
MSHYRYPFCSAKFNSSAFEKRVYGKSVPAKRLLRAQQHRSLSTGGGGSGLGIAKDLTSIVDRDGENEVESGISRNQRVEIHQDAIQKPARTPFHLARSFPFRYEIGLSKGAA